MIFDADIDQAVDELVERYGANAISVVVPPPYELEQSYS